MRFDDFSFGSIKIDDITYEDDVVIDRGEVRKRKKKPSKRFREELQRPEFMCTMSKRSILSAIYSEAWDE